MELCDTLQYWKEEDLELLNKMPFTSAAVERIFSVFKTMNRENRQSFQFENLRKFVIYKYILQKVCFYIHKIQTIKLSRYRFGSTDYLESNATFDLSFD